MAGHEEEEEVGGGGEMETVVFLADRSRAKFRARISFRIAAAAAAPVPGARGRMIYCPGNS